MAKVRFLWATSAVCLAIGGCLLTPATVSDPSSQEQRGYKVLGGTPTPPPKPTPTPPPKEKCQCDVTGGGEIFFGGYRFNFGFNALTIANSSRVHGLVNIVHTETDDHFLGDVTAIECDVDPSTTHPRLEGTVTISGILRANSTDAGEPFVFVVSDVGEPGTLDSVSFSVNGTVIFSATDLGGEGDVPPGGGNIQLHTEECEEE